MLRAFGALPGLGGLAFGVASSAWMLIAMVVAIRHAPDYASVWRAVGVVLVGWIIQVIALAIVVGAFPRPASG